MLKSLILTGLFTFASAFNCSNSLDHIKTSEKIECQTRLNRPYDLNVGYVSYDEVDLNPFTCTSFEGILNSDYTYYYNDIFATNWSNYSYPLSGPITNDGVVSPSDVYLFLDVVNYNGIVTATWETTYFSQSAARTTLAIIRSGEEPYFNYDNPWINFDSIEIRYNSDYENSSFYNRAFKMLKYLCSSEYSFKEKSIYFDNLNPIRYLGGQVYLDDANKSQFRLFASTDTYYSTYSYVNIYNGVFYYQGLRFNSIRVNYKSANDIYYFNDKGNPILYQPSDPVYIITSVSFYDNNTRNNLEVFTYSSSIVNGYETEYLSNGYWTFSEKSINLKSVYPLSDSKKTLVFSDYNYYYIILFGNDTGLVVDDTDGLLTSFQLINITLGGIGNFLSIMILPGLTLGVLLFTPLVLTLLLFIVKLFKR